MPPPPPPPPLMPGMGGPPPPPPPPNNVPSRPPPGNRGALLTDITKGRQLKKAVTNDRSAPVVGTTSGGSGPSPLASAPAVPRPPGGLAPPVPGGNRARSNSDQSGRESTSAGGMEQPPQLAGLFAGGMPKLKKRGGGVDTGASQDSSSYTSDPESSRSAVPRPPTMAAPKPPTGFPARPPPQQPAGTAPVIPSVASLRKNLGNVPRPNSSASMKGPPPPIGKKPPAPPGSRKPSFQQTFQPNQPSFIPPAPPGPPPPPTSSAPPLPGGPPPSAPRPPPTANTQSSRSLAPAPPPPPPPPPPPNNSAPTNGANHSLAVQAAIRAAGQASPSSAPPPPPAPPSHSNSYKAPAPSLPPSAPPPPSQSNSYNPSSPPPSAPPPPISRAPTVQAPIRSMLDPSAYTLSSNGPTKSPNPNRNSGSSEPSKRVNINDSRWKFQDESMLPKPRDFTGGTKRYRAGRGSSVPLDLSAFQ